MGKRSEKLIRKLQCRANELQGGGFRKPEIARLLDIEVASVRLLLAGKHSLTNQDIQKFHLHLDQPPPHAIRRSHSSHTSRRHTSSQPISIGPIELPTTTEEDTSPEDEPIRARITRRRRHSHASDH